MLSRDETSVFALSETGIGGVGGEGLERLFATHHLFGAPAAKGIAVLVGAADRDRKAGEGSSWGSGCEGSATQRPIAARSGP